MNDKKGYSNVVLFCFYQHLLCVACVLFYIEYTHITTYPADKMNLTQIIQRFMCQGRANYLSNNSLYHTTQLKQPRIGRRIIQLQALDYYAQPKHIILYISITTLYGRQRESATLNSLDRMDQLTRAARVSQVGYKRKD